MKPNFLIKQLNSPFSDPVFFVRNVYKKKAFQFDLGKMGGIDNSEILDISDVFVTHTHMDHFSGFDRFLRGAIHSNNIIRFFGPKNFIKNIQGKIDSYTWNLISDYNIEIIAIELDDNPKKVSFKAKSSFEKEELPFTQDDLNLGDGFRLAYEPFDHGIVSMGYRVIEPIIYNIRKDKLQDMGILEGAWIKEFKSKLKIGIDDTVIADTIDGKKEFQITALSDKLIDIKQRQDITYITDIAPTEDNISRAIEFAKDSYLLIIEAVFMDIDNEHSINKNHLTISKSKEIFMKSNSSSVRFIHFAPRYDRIRNEFFDELYSGIKSKIFQI